MADRRVTKTGKDDDGDITKLCNPNADWSPRYKSSAIADIESETHTYYVRDGGGRSDIHVVPPHRPQRKGERQPRQLA